MRRWPDRACAQKSVPRCTTDVSNYRTRQYETVEIGSATKVSLSPGSESPGWGGSPHPGADTLLRGERGSRAHRLGLAVERCERPAGPDHGLQLLVVGSHAARLDDLRPVD